MTHHPENDRFDEDSFNSEAVGRMTWMMRDVPDTEKDPSAVIEKVASPSDHRCGAAELNRQSNEDRFGIYGFSLDVIQNMALRLLPHDPEKAKDIAQDAAIRLLQIKDGRKISNPDEYAKTVIRNMVRDSWRKKQAKYGRERHEVSVSDFSTVAVAVQKVSEKESGREEVRRMIRITLGALADQLDNLDKSILELTRKGFSRTEIARSLDIDRGTVYYRVDRIKRLLKDLDPPDPPSPPSGGGGSRASPPVRGDPLVERCIPLTLQSQVINQRCDRKKQEISLWQNRTIYLAFFERKGGGAPLSWAERKEIGPNTPSTIPPTPIGERFKELFLQLPAFQEDNQEDGPKSLDEIEDMLCAEYVSPQPRSSR